MSEKVKRSKVNVGYASAKSLADYYDVTVKTIWEWSKEGRIPAPVKLSPGCTRWRWAEILRGEPDLCQ